MATSRRSLLAMKKQPKKPINNDSAIVSNIFNKHKGLYSFSNPSDYLVQDASGKMKDILRKNNFALEFQGKGETDYQVGGDRLKLDNPDKHRLYINTDRVKPQDREDAIRLDILSHAMHNNPRYHEFTKDLESKLVNQYGRAMVEGNGGVDAYVRGHLSNSKEYEPYKKEMAFIPKEHFSKLESILNGEPINPLRQVTMPTIQGIFNR